MNALFMSTRSTKLLIPGVLVMCSYGEVRADDRGRVALDIDAIVRVAGLPNSGTEVYIIPATGRVEHLVEGFSQFGRELDLQTTYLLSFERPGCLTKQVYIDTHVPQSFMSLSPFLFRFKVTLRGHERQDERYAGPVAFVRFNAGLSDFDYETDYRMMRDSTVFERLELARMLGPGHPSLTGVPVSSGGKASEEPPVPIQPVDPGTMVTPVQEERVRTVTRLGPERAVPDAPPAPGVTVHSALRPVQPEMAPQVSDARSMERSGTKDERELRIDRPPDPLAVGRSEELIVEKLRVTTVVKVVLNGVTTEYRRVAHYHGGVTHFMNGSPCSEAVYLEGTGY